MPRTTLCDARSTLRACKTVFRAHGPFFRARDLSGAGDFAPRNPTYPTYPT